MVARRRARVVVARFHDAGAVEAPAFRATIDWGDGTHWRGVVVREGAGSYRVQSAKRYARRGRYEITVTLADGYRVSIARSTATVRARR
jgi:hypothetical protein